jgi:hypothetical protein
VIICIYTYVRIHTYVNYNYDEVWKVSLAQFMNYYTVLWWLGRGSGTLQYVAIAVDTLSTIRRKGVLEQIARMQLIKNCLPRTRHFIPLSQYPEAVQPISHLRYFSTLVYCEVDEPLSQWEHAGTWRWSSTSTLHEVSGHFQDLDDLKFEQKEFYIH